MFLDFGKDMSCLFVVGEEGNGRRRTNRLVIVDNLDDIIPTNMNTLIREEVLA